jgi:predicted O-linked N-acetylglucosamine transferase (SPINDLY family)
VSSSAASSADEVQRLFQQALAHQRQGQAAQAEARYAQILELNPRHAPSMHLLGTLALQSGSALRACELITRSTEADPTVAVAHLDLANALCLAGKPDIALASYDRAIELKRDLFQAHFSKAVVLQDLQRLEEALKSYDRALKSQPNLVPALYNRAVVLAALNRPEEALAAYAHCLRAGPRNLEALSTRGVLLLEMKRPEEALASFDEALKAAPNLPKTLNNRGNALSSLHRFHEAVESFDRAVALEPNFFEALRNRGAALRKLGSFEAALASFDAALKLRADPSAMMERAEVLVDLKRYPEVIDALSQLLEVAPQADYAQGLRLHLQGLASDWRDYERHSRELLAAIDAGARADFPFPLLSATDSAAAQGSCARSFGANKFPAAATPLWRGKRYKNSRIRIAYVSGDLRQHPVSALMVRIFEKHDRRRFEITAISLQPEEASPIGHRVRAAFDSFIDVSRMSDRAVAELMRKHRVDIAVDLMGYTKGSRTAILAHRPAPVQVNYLGYPGTLGLPYIDYLIADEFLIPAGRRAHYAEKIVWLPECFQANDDQRAFAHLIPHRRQFGLPDFGLVFCCFNNHYKINPGCFDIWMRLLRAVAGSVLWLVAEEPGVQDNLRREAQQRGVDPTRLVFAPRIPYDEHLARLRCADLFLDTLPFNAGTTASDSLWAGVPLITCAGNAMAARMAGSLLASVGLPELITHDLAQYEALALKLATTPALMAAARSKLERHRPTAPLFDSERLCRHLESAYVAMWERCESGKQPEHIAVPARSRTS